jgi:hypothetical protein
MLLDPMQFFSAYIEANSFITTEEKKSFAIYDDPRKKRKNKSHRKAFLS